MTTNQTERHIACLKKTPDPPDSFSGAVINRFPNEVLRLATSDKQLYASYHQLLDAQVRLPQGEKWDTFRVLTDHALFPHYKNEIRFGALSLDDTGLLNYGTCALVLREDMIAHRASVFEENSVIWMERLSVKISDADNLPKGFRATWQARGKLAVAKLARKLQPDTLPKVFPKLVLEQGETTEHDQFIEVHVCGPITVRSCERVVAAPSATAADEVMLEAIKERLANWHLTLERIS